MGGRCVQALAWLSPPLSLGIGGSERGGEMCPGVGLALSPPFARNWRLGNGGEMRPGAGLALFPPFHFELVARERGGRRMQRRIAEIIGEVSNFLVLFKFTYTLHR
jgi:hypothetical protein